MQVRKREHLSRQKSEQPLPKDKQPFEMDFGSGVPDLEPLVDRVFGSLQSSFLLMPRGKGFIEYPTFETGYESLKKATDGFSKWDPEKLLAAIVQTPIAHVVIRSMLGFSPPEWAHVAEQRWEIEIPQGYMRTLDRRIRLAALTPMKERALSDERLQALVKIACELLTKRAPEAQPGFIHRLDKADTRGGHVDIKALAQVGVPYAVLLYERFLGRPFASHRDSVSGHVGDAMETPIEDLLARLKSRSAKRNAQSEWRGLTRRLISLFQTNSVQRRLSKRRSLKTTEQHATK